MFLFLLYFLPVYWEWEKTMDPDFLNVFTQPAGLNQFLAENVIAQGMYFMNEDRKGAENDLKNQAENVHYKWITHFSAVVPWFY